MRLFAIAFILFAIVLPHPLRAGDGMARIPAGEFVMGSAETGDDAPRRSLRLESFFIDRYEVTNGEYAALNPAHSFPEGAEAHPVTHVTWDEAKTYCEKLGKRLPTEEEWEKSARGSDGRIYPWGEKPLKEPAQAGVSGIVKRRVDLRKDDVSPYGIYGMATSVWEWTATAQADGERIAKGGVWNLHLSYEYSRTFDRIAVREDQRLPFLGFRCLKTADG